MKRFNKSNYHSFCDKAAEKDNDLKHIIKEYGYPPYWVRPNGFATIILTILEQQVSLASAYAAYSKLREKLEVVSPESLLRLTDEQLRACYFSRQKIIYARELAHSIANGQINLKKFFYQPDDVVRAELKKLKGIGDWTVDIYLIHALRRTDIFPVGDLALVNAIKMVKGLNKVDREKIFAIGEQWKPYRSFATLLLWHYYIKKKNIKLLY